MLILDEKTGRLMEPPLNSEEQKYRKRFESWFQGGKSLPISVINQRMNYKNKRLKVKVFNSMVDDGTIYVKRTAWSGRESVRYCLSPK